MSKTKLSWIVTCVLAVPGLDYFGQGDNTAAYNNFVSLNYGNFWTGFTPTI